ncbi:MAG: hypothetical protein J6S23_02485 [Clostridia bacterium]|nr:hypothetical protein [Clostridia bacterium]
MSLTTSEMTPADLAAVCGNNRNNDGFGFGGDGAWWIIILLLFGWGGRGFGGGFGGGNGGCYAPCATQADVRAAVDQQTLISKIDQQTYGLADSFTALNNTLNNNFRGIDNAICTLGYQNQAGVNALSAQLAQCCCDTKSAIKDVNTGIERAGWNLSKQISDCCCDVEKMNLQSRFDAQAYNCNTLQAIDKLGDRIIDYMSNEKVQALRDENQALRLAASQSAQNAFITANQEAQTAELIRRLGLDRQTCPIPAYVVPNPNCCYQYNVTPANNCGCGGSF